MTAPPGTRPRWWPKAIVGGGQTGADRGGWLAGTELGLEVGGWCPLGRRAEDGRIPAMFTGMRETPTADYRARTDANVRDSDATLVLWSRSRLLAGAAPGSGSRYTIEAARKADKRWLCHFLTDEGMGETAHHVRAWLRLHAPNVLNVAGSRESTCQGMQALTKAVLVLALRGWIEIATPPGGDVVTALRVLASLERDPARRHPGETWDVRLERSGVWVCECPDYLVRGHACKHIALAMRADRP